MKNIYLTLFLCFLGFKAFAQISLNDYKYVIVEKQFHFQNEPNEYNLNEMVKYQFEKIGFKVLLQDDKLPEELVSNYCLALNSEIVAKGLLRTKATIFLRDCNGQIIFQSNEGVTKVKDFNRAYDLAIRDAFQSFSGIDYYYIPKVKEATSQEISSDSKSEMTEDTMESKEKSDVNEAEVLTSSEVVATTTETVKANDTWHANLSAYRDGDQVYYLKPNSIGMTLITADKSKEYQLLPTNQNDVYTLKVGTFHGVVFYDASKETYTLQYHDDKGELKVKALKKDQ